MDRLSSALSRNAAFTSLRWLVTLPVLVATSVLFARYLGPEDYGTYRLVLMLAFGLEVLANPALSTAVTRFVAEQSGGAVAGSAGRVMAYFLRMTTLLYLVTILPFLALIPWLASFYGDPGLAPLLGIAALAVLPAVVATVLAAGLRGEQRFAEANLIGVLQAVLNLAGLAALFLLGYGLHAIFGFLLLLNFVTALITYVFVRGDLPLSALTTPVPPALAVRMRRYAAVIGGVSLIGLVVWDRSEVFFLGRFSSRQEVAYYSVAFTLALQARRFLPAAVGEVLFPAMSRLAGLRDEWGIGNAFVHATRYLAIIGFPLMLGGSIMARPVIALLYGAEYLPAVTVLAVLFLCAGVVSVSHPAASVILVKEQYRFLLVSSVALAVLNLGLDLVLIPRYAALGAAVANTIAQVAGVVVQMGFAVRVLGVRLPLGNLGRCLVAAVAAWLPALALEYWVTLSPALHLTLMVLAFALSYPLALAVAGALAPIDFERARELVDRLPADWRRRARGAVARLEIVAGLGAPGYVG